MATMTIHGQRVLSGEIPIAGMKNAATPILAACLLIEDEVRVHNVPEIADVRKLLDLLESLGVEVEQDGTVVTLAARNVDLTTLDRSKVKSMRSSILLLGPLLARFGSVRIPEPGGCNIGSRPLTAHIAAIEQLGGTVRKQGEDFACTLKKHRGGTVILPEFSVTATENAILASVLGDGETTILQAAAEPHVQDLCNFLNSSGAKIRGIGTHEIRITGVAKLHGGEYQIIPDTVEVGTFAVLGALLAKKELTLRPVIPEHLTAVLVQLHRIGVPFSIEDDALIVGREKQLQPFKLQTLPYPGFPTDLQASFALLATQAAGMSLIHDPMYEGRFGYGRELTKMGANLLQADPHRLVVYGPTPLTGAHIKSLDLRAGITLVIAAMVAKGDSTIENTEIIGRGYGNIAERLRAVGAKVEERT